MQMEPQEALLAAEIGFSRNLDLQQLELAINRIKRKIREREPTMKRIFIDPEPRHENSTGTPKLHNLGRLRRRP